MQRHLGRGARELLDHAAVLELVEDVARLAGAREACEPRAAGADAPARDRDAEARHLLAHPLDVDVAAREALAQPAVVLGEMAQQAVVVRVDRALGDPGHGVRLSVVSA